MDIGSERAYLLEFLHVDVELPPELRLGMGECRDLAGEGATPGRLCVRPTALNLIPGLKMGNLGILMSQDGLEVRFSNFCLICQYFAPGFEPTTQSAWVYHQQDTQHTARPTQDGDFQSASLFWSSSLLGHRRAFDRVVH